MCALTLLGLLNATRGVAVVLILTGHHLLSFIQIFEQHI
jgi:hypothetical protein